MLPKWVLQNLDQWYAPWSNSSTFIMMVSFAYFVNSSRIVYEGLWELWFSFRVPLFLLKKECFFPALFSFPFPSAIVITYNVILHVSEEALVWSHRSLFIFSSRFSPVVFSLFFRLENFCRSSFKFIDSFFCSFHLPIQLFLSVFNSKFS